MPDKKSRNINHLSRTIKRFYLNNRTRKYSLAARWLARAGVKIKEDNEVIFEKDFLLISKRK